MSQELNIFGDIAGNYKTLLVLLAKMPQSATPVSVGDMVDRGPRSKQVLEFFMANGLAVMGNHEHMMIDHFTRHRQNKTGYYEGGVWAWNGGDTTMNSFRTKIVDGEEVWTPEVTIEPALLEWLTKLPLFLKFDPPVGDGVRKDGIIITHGPIRGDFRLDQCLNPSFGFNRQYRTEWRLDNPDDKARDPDDCVLWHRGSTRRKNKEGFLQIHGHNALNSVEWYKDTQGIYAVDIDTSRAKVLTGLHWPSLELFEQEYID